MVIDSTFVSTIVHAVLPNIDNLWLGLIVVVIMYFINALKKKKQVEAGFKLGVVTGANATIQEIQQPLAENYEKSTKVSESIHKAVINPNIKSIDYKVEKAAKTLGGLGSAITQAVNILNIVAPFVFKKK